MHKLLYSYMILLVLSYYYKYSVLTTDYYEYCCRYETIPAWLGSFRNFTTTRTVFLNGRQLAKR